MLVPMKIQPIDFDTQKGLLRTDGAKPVAKSRFKRLFERQFSNVLRTSSTEKIIGGETAGVGADLEPSSVCLAKMVDNFIEESNEKQKCGRKVCSCFNGNCTDSSDDEFEFHESSFAEAFEILKTLIPCASSVERNLLADTAKIVEKNKICKKQEDCRKIVTDGLIALGYDASICKSKWEKSSSYPSGEYEYIDVIVEKERLIIDTDFRSEFEIARSTGHYKSVLQSLPLIFVGKADRLMEIVSIVSEAAKQSMKKKGMHLPPWRKSEYMRAKWLSPFIRSSLPPIPTESVEIKSKNQNQNKTCSIKTNNFSGEFELFFTEKKFQPVTVSGDSASSEKFGSQERITVVVSSWKPPAVKPKTSPAGTKMVAGLASVFEEK